MPLREVRSAYEVHRGGRLLLKMLPMIKRGRKAQDDPSTNNHIPARQAGLLKYCFQTPQPHGQTGHKKDLVCVPMEVAERLRT